MIETVSTIRVRYAETDKMGIVYHSNYLPWLEIARIEMLEKLGTPYRELEAEGYLLPVLEANLKYLKPARFDDYVTVHLQITEKPRIKIRIHYEVRRGEDLLAKADTLHAFMSPEGAAIKPSPRFLAVVAQHFEG